MSSTDPPQTLLSLVIPCFNEEAVLPLLEPALLDMADRLKGRYEVEIVLIDDGSRDRTWELIRDFASRDGRVRGVALARNFGHQMALTCGYELARGGAVVSMDADLQDPPEVVPAMLERFEEGADVVYAVRAHRAGETRFKLWTAALFYRLMRALGAGTVRDESGDFRLLSRRALDALNQLREQHRFIRGMVGWIGFRTTEVRYERQARAAGSTKYPLGKMLRLAIDAMVSFSIVPLRLTYLLAGLMSAAVLSYLGYVTFQHFVNGAELVPGWTSLLLSIMAFGALTMVSLGIMGEYVGRIYEQSKGRPLYLIREVYRREEGTGEP